MLKRKLIILVTLSVVLLSVLFARSSTSQLSIVNCPLSTAEPTSSLSIVNCPLSIAEQSSAFLTEYETTDFQTGEKVTKQLAVYLPPEYDETSEYNACFLMHISGSDEGFWLSLGIQALADEIIAQGLAEPFILFMPDGYLNDDYRTHRNDSTVYTQFAQEFREDIIPFVKENYPLREGREHFGFIGASFGAYMTVNSILAPNLDLVSNFGYIGGGTIEQSRLEESWSAAGTEALPVSMLYIGEGALDDRGPAELSYMCLLAGCSKFTEDNLVFSLMDGLGHESGEWLLGFQEAIALFYK